jgi:hypothetical protein
MDMDAKQIKKAAAALAEAEARLARAAKNLTWAEKWDQKLGRDWRERRTARRRKELEEARTALEEAQVVLAALMRRVA